MDEFTAVIEGTPVGAWVQYYRDVPSYSINARLEPTATATMSRKHKARGMTEWAGYALPTEWLLRFPNHIPQQVFR